MEASTKSCGDCGVCCKMMGVAELEKRPGQRCANFKRGLGCRIYEGRPKACADFICYWLHAPNLGEDWRPDRTGFVMHVSEAGRVLNIEVDPASPQTWRKEPYSAQLAAWAKGGAARALELLVWQGRRCIKITAEGEVDLGLRRPAA